MLVAFGAGGLGYRWIMVRAFETDALFYRQCGPPRLRHSPIYWGGKNSFLEILIVPACWDAMPDHVQARWNVASSASSAALQSHPNPKLKVKHRLVKYSSRSFSAQWP